MRARLWWWLQMLLILLLASPSLPVLAAPAADTAIFVFPTQAAPSALLTVTGYGLTPSTAVEVLLVNNGDHSESSLGFATTDATGGLTLAATPTMRTPGAYTILINNRTRTPTVSFTVVAGPTLRLTQAGGPPGTPVEFTVDLTVA